MRIIVPISDVMFLVRLLERNLAMFGLAVTYVFTGSAERSARIGSIVGDARLVASDAEEDWPVLWERVLRHANESDDIWMLESDIFFESRRWLDRLAAVCPALDLVGAYPRRGGFAPCCLWVRQGLLGRHRDCSIRSQTIGGVYYDVMDYNTKRMADAGARCHALPPVDMHHVRGISVAKQELARLPHAIANVASLYDIGTVRYVAESIMRYRAMLDRWGQADDFAPPEADYRAIMRAIAARGVDVANMSEPLRVVEPLERLFPSRA
jgi:hypothetical protein